MNEYIIWLQKPRRYYPFKIYREDVLIHDFTPCYRKKDGVLCFYDKITDKIYTDSNSKKIITTKEVFNK